MSDLILPDGVEDPRKKSEEPTDEFQLYPSEEQLIASHWEQIQKKWMGRPDTKENLHAMANETENRMKEIGFLVEVDIANMEFVGDQYLASPVIYIVGRVKNEKGHDHEKHAHEVQSGLQDGKAYGVDEHGRVVEPKKTFTV